MKGIDARAWPALAAALLALVGIGWGLPGGDTWAEDAMSPRTCGLFGIAETYWPGHFHAYPPLHVALLTLTSLPWELPTVVRVGLDRAALEQALIAPSVMTPVELSARLVAVAMLAGIVWNVTRLFERMGGRRVGIAAGAVVGASSALVYYGHTGALEVPYLFWSAWAMVEIDRVLAGERREPHVMALVACAVLTKDQAAGFFLLALPACLVARPELLRSRRTWGSLAGALAAYAVVAGAVTNPTGFAERMRMLLGPMASDWTPYPRTAAGYAAMTKDALAAVPGLTSWPIAIAAVVGAALALGARHGVDRARAAMPLVASLSYTLTFLLGARRTEDRFLLPFSLFLFPYAAFALEAWLSAARSRSAPWLPRLVAAVALAPALLSVASLDATLLADSRYTAERFLASLPAGTRVEAYGGSHFLPRFPAQLDVTRVGLDPPGNRSHAYRVTDVLADPMRIDQRRPDVVVLGAEHSHPFPAGYLPPARYGTTEFTDAASFRFFEALTSGVDRAPQSADAPPGTLDYDRVLVARCALPWPLSCREIHGSTGRDVWIYERRSPRGAKTDTPMR